jgi:diguanylate cyclase (GGDEF)-like protein/PAS domain S-box-containing protein
MKWAGSLALHERAGDSPGLKARRGGGMNPPGSLWRAILFPLGAALLVLILLAVYAVERMNRQHVAETIAHHQRLVHSQYEQRLASEAAALGALLDVLTRDARLIEGLRRRDRAALLRDTADYYPSLRDRHGITHFYFTGPDRVNLLRVHAPERHGDVIDRFTTRQAERNGAEAWGVELGPLGLFTLRVVRPVFSRGRLLGYMELGLEIGHVIRAIAAGTDAHVHLLIDKRWLDRAKWEAGRALLGNIGDWDRFPDRVLMQSTAPPDAVLLARLSDTPATRSALLGWEELREPLVQPLRDVAGREVGVMVVTLDVSAMAGQSRWLAAMVILVGLALGMALMAGSRFLLRRVELQLSAAQSAEQAAFAEREAESARHLSALANQEEQVRLLLNSTAEAIYGVDTQGLCTFVNPAFLAMMGYDRVEDVLGRDIHALIHHSHADGRPYPGEHCQVHRALLSNTSTHADDEVFWHKDGHAIPVEYWAHPIRRDGAVAGVVAAFLDISARKRADAELRASEARLKEAQRLAQIGDWELDLASGRLTWSAQIYRIFEMEPAQFGATLDAFLACVHPDDRAEVERAYADSVARRQPYDVVHRLRMADGRVKYVHERGETHYDASGRPTRSVGTVQDVTEMKLFEQRLQHQAYHDALTGLPNRALLQARLQQALERARRHGHRGALLFIDLDQFKHVNDSLGHLAGDALLIEVARRIRARARREDTLARLGGDEFVVLLECLDHPEDAATLARDLIAALNLPTTLEGGHTLYIGASIGICVFPDDGAQAETLLRNADAALFQAKGAGRNTYRYYTEALTLAARERLELELGLRRALEAGEFLLHYQPQVMSADRGPIGVEALVRWRPPDGDLVPPARFIPVAEETGLIVAIGEWVLRSACAQGRAWMDAGLPALTMAVNLSPRQFHDPELLTKIRRALDETGFPPERLELEITEGVVMEQGEHAISLLGELKALGVMLAIDDFGTGYSSLAYLKRFAIDKLKIDQSFVRDIPESLDSMEITASIIAMAKNLRLKVLAEGVETEDQLAFLQIHNCDACQGYLFGQPVPADALVGWLTVNTTP